MAPPPLRPARELDALDHVERVPRGEPKGPSWRVRLEYGGRVHERHFRDSAHGSAPASLAAAVEWRDGFVTRINNAEGGLRSARTGDRPQALGVWIGPQTVGDHTYRVARSAIPATDDEPRRVRSRSIDKYGPVEALRQCAEFRFEGMKERYGDAYPYDSADDLLADVLAAEGIAV